MDGFAQWAERHATVFGFDRDALIRMLLSWEDLFDAAGYTAAELNQATDWLATHAPPEFPSQHLRCVQLRIRAVRAVDMTNRHSREDVPLCVLCGGGGMVEVPDVRGVSKGRWVGFNIGAGPVFYTHAALCTCYRGRNMNCTNRNGDRLIELATYENANPGWREQMAARARELSEAARLGDPETARAVDRVLASSRNGRKDEHAEPVF